MSGNPNKKFSSESEADYIGRKRLTCQVDTIGARRSCNIGTIVYQQLVALLLVISAAPGRELVEHFGAQVLFPDLNKVNLRGHRCFDQPKNI